MCRPLSGFRVATYEKRYKIVIKKNPTQHPLAHHHVKTINFFKRRPHHKEFKTPSIIEANSWSYLRVSVTALAQAHACKRQPAHNNSSSSCEANIDVKTRDIREIGTSTFWNLVGKGDSIHARWITDDDFLPLTYITSIYEGERYLVLC